MKVMSISFMMAWMCMYGAGCELEVSSDTSQAQKTERALKEADKQIGMPNIVNYQERKLMKSILDLRDKEDLVCFAYIVNLEGQLIFLGKCVGFGLPYSVQYTNPQKYLWNRAGGYRSLPQADPNGLFMPDGLAATWLMLIDPDTEEVRPVYVEPEILVSPFPLHDEVL